MEAVVTVIGRDAVGILARVCTACSQANANIEEVSQRILKGTFAMIMLVDLSKSDMDFFAFSKMLAALGSEMQVQIHCTQQELFDTMHHI